jgi:hypothetical protein
MKKVILGLLTITAFGTFVSSVNAQESNQSSATGNNAVIQSVDMTTDQYGTNNSSRISGSMRNSVRGSNGEGSNGVVQEGRVEVIQTGDGNVAESEFDLRNRIDNTSPSPRGRAHGRRSSQ